MKENKDSIKELLKKYSDATVIDTDGTHYKLTNLKIIAQADLLNIETKEKISGYFIDAEDLSKVKLETISYIRYRKQELNKHGKK